MSSVDGLSALSAQSVAELDKTPISGDFFITPTSG
jgi:hypothetical protein